MKLHIKYLITIFLVSNAWFASPVTLQAQTINATNLSNARVDQLSDQQITQFWQQAQRGGLSETEALNLLVKRGFPTGEVNALKKRLFSMQTRSKSGGKESLLKDTAGFMKDSSWMKEVPAIKRKSPYYGFDFFNNPAISFEPNQRLTTPQGYVLGPGDELSINYTGLNEASVNELIDYNGKIVLPYAGSVQIGGLTLEEATRLIKSKMKVAYPAISSGKTQVLVTVTNFKTIGIKVVGEAEIPGTYQVSSLASFFNVLYKANGPSENGSLRKIQLIRNNKPIATIDLYQFLQTGSMQGEVKLQDEDVIHIPVYNKRVSITGKVKRPMIYELQDKETLQDLLQLAGGFESGAVESTAKIIQQAEKERKVRDIAAADFAYFIPRNGDQVEIGKILSTYSNRVIISGAVQRPGSYELTNQLTVSRLIKQAEGVREDALMQRGYLVRRQAGTGGKIISFHVQDILTGKQSDILLEKEDSITIVSKDSLRDIPSVVVAGNVNQPITIPYREGLTVEDAIILAGGFSFDAATHKIEISRLQNNRADTLANSLIQVLTVAFDSSRNNGKKTLLAPLDYVFVPQLLNYRNLGKVKVRGEVLYAGDYALEKRNETIQEVLLRSGGISPFAAMADVQVYRRGLRVGTDVLSENTAVGDEKFLLQPDDSIYVPKKQSFVEVQGAVFNPQILRYDSQRFLSYISDAGGITDKGNLKKSYVQYSNGINRKIHHFLFFRRYPKVTPGSKIIVPEKSESIGRGLSVIEISSLVGSLATLVSLIAVLKK
ncbi:MAG: SLBB domain-containing protein [Chitinophagia bacterium]|jgi:protein involved in polysaccharide export with SLBB domain